MISPEPSLTVHVEGSGVLGVRRLERAGMIDSPDTTIPGGQAPARLADFGGSTPSRSGALHISAAGERSSSDHVIHGTTVSARQARLNSRSKVSAFEPFAILAKGATFPGVARGGEAFANGVLPWRHFRNSSTLI